MNEEEGDLCTEVADCIELNLGAFLNTDRIVRDIRWQWMRNQEAILPLLVLGSEEDLPQLWTSVQALDQRFSQQAFSMDDLDDIRLLESALDSVSFCMLEVVQPRISARYPGVTLHGGLLEGYWCLYAQLPRGKVVLPSKPCQKPLFT